MANPTAELAFSPTDGRESPWALATAVDESARRLVSETTREGALVQDASGAVVWFNRAACRMLRQEPEQLAARTSLDTDWPTVRLDGSYLPGDRHPAIDTLRTGSPVNDVIVGVDTGSGSDSWFSMSSTLVADDGERFVVTVLTDKTAEVTSRRELGGIMGEISRTLTPTRLPANGRVRFSVASRSPEEASQSGARFHSAHQLTPDRYGFFVGNVDRRGMSAAYGSSLARCTLRSAAALLDGTDDVLRHLYGVLAAEDQLAPLAAICGSIDVGATSTRVRLSSTGHMQPILLSGEGVRHVGLLAPDSRSDSAHAVLSEWLFMTPGDRLILCTDDLVALRESEIDLPNTLGAMSTTATIAELAERALEIATRSDGVGSPVGDVSVLAFEIV